MTTFTTGGYDIAELRQQVSDLETIRDYFINRVENLESERGQLRAYVEELTERLINALGLLDGETHFDAEMNLLTLKKQLADMTKERNAIWELFEAAKPTYNEMKNQLAACEKERDTKDRQVAELYEKWTASQAENARLREAFGPPHYGMTSEQYKLLTEPSAALAGESK
jgi:chromosome segregation ATPase